MSRGESHTLKNSLHTVVTCYYLQIKMSKFCHLNTDYELNIMKDLVTSCVGKLPRNRYRTRFIPHAQVKQNLQFYVHTALFFDHC